MRVRGRRQDPPAAQQPSAAEMDLARVLEALESVPLGVIVEDEGGRSVARNGRARSPFGDLQGDALASATVARVVSRARGGQHAAETLTVHRTPARVVDVAAIPLVAGGVVAVLADMSERRQLDDMRRDFLANVNHELRTPIGALGLLAEALSDESDLVVVRRLAQRIAMEAERAGALIADLLEFSRVETGEHSTTQVVAVADIVGTAVERVMAQAEQAKVRLEVEAGDGDATIDGDPEQLISALVNLVDNAVKYSGAGSTVTIATNIEGGSVQLQVVDQGIGIPSKDIDRIFERFYRVDRARDRRTGGTGLGLAIVRHVATNHGGEVTVSSREGEGSTFTLRLPAVRPSSD